MKSLYNPIKSQLWVGDFNPKCSLHPIRVLHWWRTTGVNEADGGGGTWWTCRYTYPYTLTYTETDTYTHVYYIYFFIYIHVHIPSYSWIFKEALFPDRVSSASLEGVRSLSKVAWIQFLSPHLGGTQVAGQHDMHIIIKLYLSIYI